MTQYLSKTDEMLGPLVGELKKAKAMLEQLGVIIDINKICACQKELEDLRGKQITERGFIPKYARRIVELHEEIGKEVERLKPLMSVSAK